MQLLNSGDYWNRKGTYASNGLTTSAKTFITNAKWYLGGGKDYQTSSDGLVSHFYSYERETTVYDNAVATSWVGKVGLMYPSDYGYATGGGTTNNRESCLSKEKHGYSTSDCKNNDWLYDSSDYQWTLTPNSNNSEQAFCVNNFGNLDHISVRDPDAVRPTVYLASDIQITGGDGTIETPYEISK